MTIGIKNLCDAIRRMPEGVFRRVSEKPIYDLTQALAARWQAPDEIRYILLCSGLDPTEHHITGCDPRACWAAVVERAYSRGSLSVLLDVIEREWQPIERVIPR